MEQKKTKNITVGSISTKKEGNGVYLKVGKEGIDALKQAINNATKNGKDLYLNVEFFEENLRNAAKAGKLSVTRTEKQQQRVQTILEKAPGILSDVSVSVPLE